jgi:ABC-type Na+ efflux pump permease subunit
VLRLSPASGAQIVLAKALVGLTYCLIVGSIALLFNWRFVVHAWLGLLTIVILGFFAICLGLFIGLLVENISSINLWMTVSLYILIVPIIVLFIDPVTLPAWVNILMDWIPTVAASDLLRMSFLKNIYARMLVQPLGVLIAAVLLAFFGVVKKLNREDRV